MIEFQGILSNRCKKFIIDTSWKLGFITVIIVCIPIMALSIVLAYMYDWIYLLILIPVALFISFVALKPGTKAYRKLFGNNGKIFDGSLAWNIVIDGITISAEGINRSETRYLNDVKKVVDLGEWYKIYFCFPHKSNLFVCQKDLITQGTLEEFEAMFKVGIVRKKP